MFENMLIVVAFLIASLIGFIRFSALGRRFDNFFSQGLFEFEDRLQRIHPSWISVAIIISSAAILFLELSIIRLQGGYVQVLALLKNISLLSCFLGLGVGFVLRRSVFFSLPLMPLLLLFQVIFLKSLYKSDAYRSLGNPFADEGMVGLASVSGFDSALVIGVVVIIFTINALTFAPLGRLLGNLMQQLDGVIAYRYNLIGSILGIGLFSVCSYLWLGGALWMIGFTVLITPFFLGWNIISLGSLSLLLMTIFVADHSAQLVVRRIYTPYQTLELINSHQGGGELSSNSLYYQRMINLSDQAVANTPSLSQMRGYYDLPFKLLGPSDRVLIIGSGTGNDVAAALRGDIKTIKAIEIDPVILKVGSSFHPEKPYASPKVLTEVTDARAYMKRADEKFDGIVFGLVDSHALLSGRVSGLRLDSYVYTVEAFKEAKALLKPDGLFVISFVYMSPEIGRKLFLMLTEAFDGQQPTVIRTAYDSSITFIAGRALSEPNRVALGEFEDISGTLAEPSILAEASTDDWPYFYMPRKVYPVSYFWLWAPLLAISVALFKPALKVASNRFDWCAFFLGASFMLIETKAFTEMALVWGSTFSVTTFVLFLVLVLGLISNEIILRRWRVSPGIAYLALFGSLALGYGTTFMAFAYLPLWLEGILRGAIMTLPLLFAGICFSSRLEDGGDVSGTMAANLLGAMFGGILEYTSMFSGFRFLYVVASGLYILSFVSLILSTKKIGKLVVK